MSVSQASAQWGISDRRIRTLCKEGKIAGAIREGRAWRMPCDAKKPSDGRYKKEAETKSHSVHIQVKNDYLTCVE